MTNQGSEEPALDQFVLIWGLDCEYRELSLGPDILLRRVEEFNIFDLAALGAAGFVQWGNLANIAGPFFEIVSFHNPQRTKGYDTINRAWLASALLTLRGFTRHLPVATNAYSWSEMSGISRSQKDHSTKGTSSRKLARFRGGLLDFHVTILAAPNAKQGSMTQDDASWINQNFELVNTLAVEPKFRFALEGAVHWRLQRDARAAIALMWAGIESLFDASSELTFRISISAASVLEQRGDRRFEKFREIRRLYEKRSQVVHGAQMSNEDVQKTLSESFSLLRDLLFYTIELGRVPSREDFERAVFT